MSGLSFFVSVWVKFFFLFTPFSALSMFLGLTRGYTEAQRRRLALQVSAAVALLCFALFFFGRAAFALFGITLDAFRVGAGALLFLSAVILVQATAAPVEPRPDEDIAVVPLAMPIIVGPATIGTLLVLGAEITDATEKALGCLALAVAVVSVGVLLRVGSVIERVLGRKGINILGKVSGLVLAALAAQMVLTGIEHHLGLGPAGTGPGPLLAPPVGGVAGRAPAAPDIALPADWLGNIDRLGFNEPSGLCWHPGRRTLFVVGDAGDICELRTDGEPLQQAHVRDADFEGITCDPSTGLLYVAVEGQERILEIDPDSLAVRRSFDLPREVDGRLVLAAGGQGVEAITFVPDAGHSQGGVFWVANQSFDLDSDDDLSAIFFVELPLRDPGTPVRITGHFAPGVIDLSGLYHDPVTDHVFVISDAANAVLEYARDLRRVAAFALPGDDQEGLAADDQGFLYLAQDSGGIIRLRWRRGL